MQEYMIVASLATALVQGEPLRGLTADELADKLGAANVLLNRDFDTTFEYRVLKAGPLEDDDPWDAQDWELLESFRYVALGDKLYILRVSYKRPEGGSGVTPIVQYRQENIWANGAWALRVEGDNAVSFYAQPGPTDLHSHGFKFNLLEGRYPSALRTVAELVRTGTVLDQRVEDDVLTYRFSKDDVPASRLQYTIRVQTQPNPAMLDYSIELSDSPTIADFAQYVYSKQSYSVLEWQETDQLRIPRIAEIQGVRRGNRSSENEPRLRLRAIYTRKSFRQIAEDDIDPGLFTVPLPIGTGVYDDRIKLSFEIGGTYLSLDGVLYEVDQPIMEHPGDRLGEMIRQATPQHPPAGSSSPSASAPDSSALLPPTDSDVLGSRLVLAGLVGAAAALLTVAVIRSRRARRKAA